MGKTAQERIHSLMKFGMVPGLQRITALMDRLGNPQDKLKFVHVTGTNGKGSTCTMLSNVLRESGYQTGLFLSPYVVDFRERIQVNNQMIPAEELEQIMDIIDPLIEVLSDEGLQPTEFEVITAIAFYYFYRKQCDVVVLEVGMGGLLDSTNIIDTPLASVFASVAVDHTKYLGETVQEIAEVKCGIIKPDGVTVCYPQQNPEALRVIMEHCSKKNNHMAMGNLASVSVLEQDVLHSLIVYDGIELHIPFGGAHQIANAVNVVETVKVLNQRGLSVPEDAIQTGIAVSRLAARMEVLQQNPMVILDGAHNANGAQALGESLRKLLNGKKIISVAAMMEEKDDLALLHAIAPISKQMIFTKPKNPRSMDPKKLEQKAKSLCKNSQTIPSVRQAVEYAMDSAGTEDVIVICGSLYLASDVKKEMNFGELS